MERHGFSGYWREWWHFEHRVQGRPSSRPHAGLSAPRTRDNRAMSELLRVALAQIDPKVGDIRGNARKIADYTARAREREAALVVFPELALTGYPPEDLLLKTGFLDAAAAALDELAAQTHGIVAVVGFPQRADDVYNAAAVLADGRVAAVYRKMYLPNYGVFDEQRYFQCGLRGDDVRAERRPDRALGLRGHLGAGPAGDDRGAGRRSGAGQPLRLAVPARLRRPARAHDRPARRGLPGRRGVREHRRRPGRAGLRRPQRGREPRGRVLARGAAVRGVAGRVHASIRARSWPPACATPGTGRTCAASASGGGPPSRCRWSARPEPRRDRRPGRPGGRRAGAAARLGGGRGVRGAAHGAARLRREERLRAGGAGALRRDRLRARRADRRGRARLRSG